MHHCVACVKTEGASYRSVIFFLQKGGSDIVVGIALGFVLFEDGRRDDPYIRCICLQHNNETARYMWL